MKLTMRYIADVQISYVFQLKIRISGRRSVGRRAPYNPFHNTVCKSVMHAFASDIIFDVRFDLKYTFV